MLETLVLAIHLVAAPAEGAEPAAANPPDAGLRERIVQEVMDLSERILAAPDDNRLRSRRGDLYFFAGQFAYAVGDYEHMLRVDPGLLARHWRLGLAYYYAGRHGDAARQFARYYAVDDVDRENGIWHYFSLARELGLETARRRMFRYTKKDREPLGDVWRMLLGEITGKRMLERIEAAGIDPAERAKRLFYAHLYIGLDAAVHGDVPEARAHLRLAAASSWPRGASYGPRYMWHVGRLQLDLIEHPPAAGKRPVRVKKVAAVVTEYRHNSHADVIVSRLLQTDTLDGKGRDSPLELVSLYTDQRPANDISRMLAASHRFRLSGTIADALTLGTGRLAVDGVLLIAEHGRYPRSPNGNTRYPKRRFWEEIAAVFRASGRSVPVFCDKHLADNWDDAKAILDEARALGAPLMAGSSVPGTWRRPAADVERGAALEGIVALTYGSTDAYGFHALEAVQALAEQRRGGETGIAAVRCLTGDAVWKAIEGGEVDADLLAAARGRVGRDLAGGRPLREAVEAPVLFHLEYADGLRADILELNGAVDEWTAAWRTAGGRVSATRFWTQEARPAMHFTWLLRGIETMMLTGTPAWPAERTLLTSGALDALLTSRLRGGVRLETPHLEFAYSSSWRWSQPPPPPPGRPWPEQ